MVGWLPDAIGGAGLLLACFASYKWGYERGRRVQVQDDIKALGPVESQMDRLKSDLAALERKADAEGLPRDPPSGPRQIQ